MRRRIALISEHASPLAIAGGVDCGGQNVYVGQVARQLVAQGHDVDVLTRRDAPELARTVTWGNGVRVIHVDAGPPAPVPKEELLPYMPAFLENTLSIGAGRNWDLVHANFFMSAWVAAELRQRLGTPFVVTFHALGKVRRLHQGDADHFPAARLTIEARVVREADRIIAECPQDEADLVGHYGADPRRISVVPCGFDPTEFWPISRPLARVLLGLGVDEPVLLQLGRMVPRKGVETVLEALGVLAERHGRRPRLLVVGGDSSVPDPVRTPEIGRLQRVAEQLGISEQVTWVGQRDRERLKYYYAAADAFISVPWYEPFGITPLEAMACGIPVIGSAVGGIKYSVRHGETGFLVPPRDPTALAERIAFLIEHPAVAVQLRSAAIRRANALFTWERVATLLDDVYGQVLGAGTRLPATTYSAEWRQA